MTDKELEEAIHRHLPLFRHQSFAILAEEEKTQHLIALMSDEEGEVWVVEMSRISGEILRKRRASSLECMEH